MSNKFDTPPVVEVTEEKAAGAVETLKKLIEEGHPASSELKIALFALCSYVKVVRWLSQRGMGIKLLRHLLGMGQPPEPGPKPPPRGGSGKKKKKGRHNHGRRGSKDFSNPVHRYFAHPEINNVGELCKECKAGGLYPHYGQWHRFEGQPLLRVVVINYEIWRCTLCQKSYPAPIAADILEDGPVRQTFGYSATALIVISKHFLGTPWARQQRLQKMLELPLSASTLGDRTREFGELIAPLYDYLIKLAANSWLFGSDDTGIRILKVKSEIKIQRKTQKETLRTGVHTSAVLAELEGNIRLALFKSGIHHAGEFLDEILLHRDPGLPPPIHMADGSSCNPATVCETLEANCNAHGRRKLEEKKDNYPEHWEVVRSTYKEISEIEKASKEKGLNIHDRLALHKEKSRPLMDALFDWMEKELNDKNVEPNSQLGGIFEYFVNRRQKLLAFTEYPGAPIDNNAVEQLIKPVALIRKNAMFFMSLNGARDADRILSVGITAGMAGVNLYDYFVGLQRYANEVKANPQDFLPWNYQETVQLIRKKRSEDTALLVQQEMTTTQWQERHERLREQRTELRNRRFPRKKIPPPKSRSI